MSFLLLVGARPAPDPVIIPVLGLREQAQLALKPSTYRNNPILSTLGFKLAGRALFPIVRHLLARRGLDETEPFPNRPTATPLAWGDFGEKYPRAFWTHPDIQALSYYLTRGELNEALALLNRPPHRIQNFLRPLYWDLLQEIITRYPRMDLPPFLRERLDPNRERFAAEFGPHTFANINVRDLVAYQRHFFGTTLLEQTGIRLKPEQTALARYLAHLPTGAIVFEYGGGAGVAAAQLKGLRPDLLVYVNDLAEPERILNRPDEAQQLERLRVQLTYLTGDAMTTALPDGQRPDLIFACSLLPYLENPLGFIARAYNQLAPDGVLLVTLPSSLFNIDADWQPNGNLGAELATTLQRLRIQHQFYNSGNTLALKRTDDRDLEVTATLVAASLEHNLIGTRFIDAYEHFYRKPAAPETGLLKATRTPPTPLVITDHGARQAEPALRIHDHGTTPPPAEDRVTPSVRGTSTFGRMVAPLAQLTQTAKMRLPRLVGR